MKQPDRYHRQWILPEIGLTGQQKLSEAKVLIIGAGGLGCPVLQYLAAAGVGRLTVVDFDIVDLSNLQRQVLFTTNDIGKSKAVVAKKRLLQLNAEITVEAINDKLNDSNADQLISDADIVVDASDNFTTRFLLNRYCAKHRIPLVYGAIHRFEGQVTVFHYRGSPGLEALFPEVPDDEELSSCAEIGVVGALPGIVGSIQALEVIKIITEAGKTLNGKLWIWDTLKTEPQILTYWEPDQDFMNCNLSDEKNIRITELDILRNTYADLKIVDVREAYEFEAFNLGGENIPLADFTSRVWSDSKPLLLVCNSGLRSQIAFNWLKANYKEVTVFHLSEGIKA